MLVLADFSNDDGISWPSVDTIARKARCSPRTIQRITSQLEASGKLRVDHEGAQYGTNLYTITIQGCQTVTPGCKSVTGGVTKTALRGDTSLSPNPSVPTIEPPAGGVSKSDIGKSLHLERVKKAKQESSDSLKNRFCAEVAGGGFHWSDLKAREAYRKLRAEISEITNQIAGMS